jgi:hypothetical protein
LHLSWLMGLAVLGTALALRDGGRRLVRALEIGATSPGNGWALHFS